MYVKVEFVITMNNYDRVRIMVDSYVQKHGSDTCMNRSEFLTWVNKQNNNISAEKNNCYPTDISYNLYNEGLKDFPGPNLCLWWEKTNDTYRLVGSKYKPTGEVIQYKKKKNERVVGIWNKGSFRFLPERGQVKCQTIKSISEFIEAISKIKEDDYDEEENLMSRKEILFRGQSNTDYKLVPSLGRYKNGQEDLFFTERNLIETARYKMPNVFTKDLEPIELLELLQHYGIPTRLLDLTENALVALYFACAANPEKSGEVFMFKNYYLGVANYPVLNAIADSYRFSKGSFYSLKLFYEDVIQQPYFLEQRNSHKDSMSGGKWIASCCESPLFLSSSVRSARQQIQSGRYLLFPNHIEEPEMNEEKFFYSRIDPIPKDSSCVIGRIVIPPEYKKKILDEMKLLGIERGMLFSDSIDITCEEITKKFFSI